MRTREQIKSACVIGDGDCWNYTSAKHQTSVSKARRDAWGKRIPPLRFLTYRCSNPACVNPEHAKVVTRAELVLLHGKTAPLQMRLKVTAARRAQAPKLDLQRARAVRARRCEGVAQHKVAAEFGISKRMVQLIESGRAWREAASPFGV